MGAIIMDFGKNEKGIHLYRINGSKAEIEKAIDDLKALGCEMQNDPFEFEKSHKHFSVLVHFSLPEVKEEKKVKKKKEKAIRGRA